MPRSLLGHAAALRRLRPLPCLPAPACRSRRLPSAPSVGPAFDALCCRRAKSVLRAHLLHPRAGDARGRCALDGPPLRLSVRVAEFRSRVGHSRKTSYANSFSENYSHKMPYREYFALRSSRAPCRGRLAVGAARRARRCRPSAWRLRRVHPRSMRRPPPWCGTQPPPGACRALRPLRVPAWRVPRGHCRRARPAARAALCARPLRCCPLRGASCRCRNYCHDVAIAKK